MTAPAAAAGGDQPELAERPLPDPPLREAAPGPGPRLRGRSAVVGVVSLLAVLLLHRAWELLGHPYWVDEAWVAVTTRVGLADLPQLTASTPLGWALLLRLPAALPGEPLRLLPLLFHAAAVAAAVPLGRALVAPDGVERRLAGPLLAAAVALAPFLLTRDDLKPYTADAAVVVVVLLLVARLDRHWTAGRVWALALGASAAFLVSFAAAFACAAALLALAAVALARRQWRRALVTTGAGVTAAAVLLLLYALAVLPVRTDALDDYWTGYYLPAGAGAALDYLQTRSEPVAGLLGVWTWWVLAPLLLAGLVALRRRPAVLATVGFLVLLALVAGRLEAYPLLDARTSTYLLTALLVVAVAGVLELRALAARQHRLLGALVVAAFAAGLGAAAVEPASTVDLPDEDVASPVAALEERRRPGEAVVVSLGASWGFAHSWRADPPAFPESSAVATGFGVSYPPATGLVVATDRTPEAVLDSLARACRLAEDGRVWRIRSHVLAAEAKAWARADARLAASRPPTGARGLELVVCR